MPHFHASQHRNPTDPPDTPARCSTSTLSTEHHEHHAMPTSGRAHSQVALSATRRCLTACAIGQVLGMFIGYTPAAGGLVFRAAR